MKNLLLLILLCTLTFNACTVEQEPPTIELNSCDDQVKIQKLVDELKKANEKLPQSRRWKFWDRLISVIYSDACGYSWGRRHNLSWQYSLISGGVSSFASIFSSSSTIATTEDCINPTYNVEYTNPISQAEIIGTTHNEAIAQITHSTPNETIQIDENLISKMTIQVNECLKQYTDITPSRSTETRPLDPEEVNSTIDFPAELQTELITFSKALAQQNGIEDTHQLAIELLPTEKDVLDLLEQYAISLGGIDNKDEIRTFTIQLNQAIDESSISADNVEYLKTIIAIAENSYSLWNIKE